MKKTLLLSIVLGICLSFSSKIDAQDLRYSQYNLSPLVLNPALTGLFAGDYRFTGIYRSQWGNLSGNSLFSTPAISFDMPMQVAFARNDAIGAGIYIVNDNEGNGILSTQHIMLSGAYHKVLDADRKHNISFGLQLGYVQKTLDHSSLTFADQWDGAEFSGESADIANLNGPASYMNVNLGLNYRFAVRQGLTFNAGVAFDNVLTPTETLLVSSTTTNERSVKSVYLLGAVYDLNQKITLEPGLRVLSQSKSSDIFLGSNVGYHLNNKIGATVWGGLWYRTQESIVLSFGLQVKKVRVGFSYDSNIHGLKTGDVNPKSAKSFEIGAVVILPIFQSVEEVIVPCLRF